MRRSLLARLWPFRRRAATRLGTITYPIVLDTRRLSDGFARAVVITDRIQLARALAGCTPEHPPADIERIIPFTDHGNTRYNLCNRCNTIYTTEEEPRG